MAETMAFDEESTRRVERLYLTPDVVEQRCRVLSELALCPGESCLDIGVGPGLLAYDIAASVGSDGRFRGVDPSEPMLEMSRRRCAAFDWARFDHGDACSLPYDADEFDAAVSTQVMEYVADVPRALGELRRVLKPGGRALILDTDYDSLVLHSEDGARTERILSAWDEHFVHRDLPRTLAGQMRRAGFEVVRQRVIPMFNPHYAENTFSYLLVRAMAAFAPGRSGVSEDEATAWLEELDALGARGEYFFSINRYLFVGRLPDS